MAKRKKVTAKKRTSLKSKNVEALPDQVSKDVSIKYDKVPTEKKAKKIHARQVLPPIEEGKKVIDSTPTPPIKVDK